MRSLFLTLLLAFAIASSAALAEPAPQLPVTGMEDYENYAHFDTSGRYLMLDTSTGLRVWDVSTLRLLKHVKVKDFLGADVSPDGRWLAIGSRPRRVQVIDLQSGKTGMDFSGVAAGQTEGAYYVAFSPDGRYLMAYGASNGREAVDKLARIWNTQSWKVASTKASDKATWYYLIWTPWSELAQLDDGGRKLLFFDPANFGLSRTVPLAQEAANLKVLGDELIAFTGTDDDMLAMQMLRKGETAARVDSEPAMIPVDETTRLTHAVSNIWISVVGYGGPAAVYYVNPLTEIGKLAWASGPPEVSPNGKLIAIPVRKGVLLLDVARSEQEQKLVPYRAK